MTILSTLPERPLTRAEVNALHESDAFVGVSAHNVIVDPSDEGERVFVIAVVFATESIILAAQYAPEVRGWAAVFREENAPAHEKNPEGVVESVVADAEAAIEELAAQLEAADQVGEVEGSRAGPDGDAVYREAEGYAEVVAQHYHDAVDS